MLRVTARISLFATAFLSLASLASLSACGSSPTTANPSGGGEAGSTGNWGGDPSPNGAGGFDVVTSTSFGSFGGEGAGEGGLGPPGVGGAVDVGVGVGAGGAGGAGGSGASTGSGGATTGGSTSSGGSTGPGKGNSMLVYSNNIENMIFDWKDLVQFMRREKRNPDLFLVQQVSGKKGLDTLTAFMSARLGEKYVGVVAQNDPKNNRFDGQVIPRPPVTTGIVWRAARFDKLQQSTWFPWGTKRDGVHTCEHRASHSGYETIRVVLDDKLASRKVAVVSLRHWTWKACNLQNMIEMVDGAKSGGNTPTPMPDVGLQIVGGDFNGKAVKDGAWQCWYRITNAALGNDSCSPHADLGFDDPLYDWCKGDKSCVRDGTQVDYLFARRKGGKPAESSNFRDITFAAGDAADKAETGSDGPSNTKAAQGWNDPATRYSGHRAHRAIFTYE